MNDQLTMFKDLTEAKGISGNEREVREVMRQYIKPYANEVYTDHLGSLIAKKIGQVDGPKIMVAGHLDEIGMMVTRIDERGYLSFQTIGGWWSQVMLAQRVTVMTSKGDLVGIVGSKPPHIMPAEARKKSYEIKDMFIDIGASSKEEAEAFGVRPGDSIVPYFEFQPMKNEKLLLAKAWDNRIGCAIAIEVLKQLKDVEHPNVVYGVGTVQEEVSLRGAKTAAHAIQPDLAFAVDTGIAGDTPGISAKDSDSKIGQGPQIVIYDRSMIGHHDLRDYVLKVAEQHHIPYQYTAIPAGGTDSGSIHLTAKGVPSLSIGIATRYIHSHAGIIHRDDFDYTVQLLVEVIKGLNQETVNQITFS
ncbi:M42 family metallopeptidase [Amphibacillus sediminis]|uniref:M42 family metallopeptidase n=1 Tax=Amphibacillus sediminis TaxID=360185 RepID=UPI000829E1E3|nr:M42 family metallopeptidase [Amphibacillus sediminis]